MVKKVFHSFLISILISITISFLLLIFFEIGFFVTWQDKLSDSLFRARPPSSQIVIIAIDNASLQKIGRWPWSRSVHAQLLENLTSDKFKPKVIGFDISFFEKESLETDRRFKLAIEKSKNVVLAKENPLSPLLPIEILRKSARSGFVDIIADSDGVTRKYKVANSFAIEILKTYLKKEEFPEKDIPGIFRINFAGKSESFLTISYSDILDGKINNQLLNDKIVLVGATAPSLQDIHLAPTSSGTGMSGVEIQANAIQTLIAKSFINEDSQTLFSIYIFVFSLIISLVFIFWGVGPGIVCSIILIFLFFVYSLFSFDKGVLKNLIYPPLSIILTTTSLIIYKYTSESRQKKFIRKAFSYYLSDKVLKDLLNDPNKLKLGGEKKVITILFSDIANFTSMSEKLSPENLSLLLNNYLSEMSKIIFTNNGVLDKFIGDGIMAFWNAPIETPDHAFLACKAALEMSQKVQFISKEWTKYGIPDFDIRIGINTGEAIVGNMGSSQRFDYSALGDSVNTASRLEGLNKEFKTHIIISESTHKLIKDKVRAKRLGEIAVKGKSKKVVVYEL